MRSMVLSALMIVFSLGGAGVAMDDNPITLVPFSVNFLGIPSFGYGENAQCDSTGDLFFHAAPVANDSVVLKVSRDESTTMYTLPQDEARKTYFIAFRVMRDGHLWILTHANAASELYLYGFGSKADWPDKITLRIPEGLEPDNFVVLRTGHVVVNGYLDAKAGRPSSSYLAEFDQSGRLVRENSGAADDSAIQALKIQVADAAAAEADDGRLYILQGNSIRVLSPSGEALSSIPVPSPGDGYKAGDVYSAGAFLAVKYRKIGKTGPINAEYALIDRSTGQLLHYYLPNSELGNNLVCYSSEGFTFLRYEKQRVKLLLAKP